MNTYARIEAGEVAELFETDQDIEGLFHSDLVWIECTGVAGVAVGWTWSDGVFSAPQAHSPKIIAANKAAARELLEATDLVAIRCVKAGVTFSAEWRAYVSALRAVVNSGALPEGGMPVRPAAYPAGS